MARSTLLAEQIFIFAPNSQYGGLYTDSFNFPESGYEVGLVDSFALVVGETYIVEWDGTEYTCVAQDASAIMTGAVAIGNGVLFGLSGNNEPFGIAVIAGQGGTIFSITETVDKHIVGIYQEVADEEPEEPETSPEEPEEPEGIVLKDRNGNDVAYYGIETVTFDTTTEGKQQTFTKGEAVEGYEIEPDFSGGDMAVVAPDGKLVKSATVKKPAALVPENIREGENVAGVVGSAFVVDTVDTVLLEQQEVPFVYDADNGGAVTAVSGLIVIPSAGMYRVYWDGTVYECEAIDEDGAILLGNLSFINPEWPDSGEPFVALQLPDRFAAATMDTADTTHTVGISQRIREDAETATVELDFAAGDQTVVPSAADKVLTEVVIRKPETLVPENIAADMVVAGVVGTHRSEIVENDVNFYDHYGTLLYSYSLEEAKNLTELPEIPDRSTEAVPLKTIGWNYTLEQIRALVGPMNIGATYEQVNGITVLHISIPDKTILTIPLYFYLSSGALIIGWGDGTNETINGPTGYLNRSHTYAQPGDYYISLWSGQGRLALGSSGEGIFGSYANTNRVVTSMLKGVYCGSSTYAIHQNAFNCCYGLETVVLASSVVNIGDNAFRDCPSLKSMIIPQSSLTALPGNMCSYCYSLKVVSIPETITTIGTYAFYYCLGLPTIRIPKSVSAIGSYAFASNRSMGNISLYGSATGTNAFRQIYALKKLTIDGPITSLDNYSFDESVALSELNLPNTLKTIGQYALRYAYSLSKLTIPASVTSIGANAFASCFGMKEYHFKSTTPPTLANTNAFSGIPTGCKIFVPSSSLSAYKSAANWSTYSSYMVGE